MQSICGPKESEKTKVDEEGFTTAKAEKPTKATGSSTAPLSPVLGRRPVLQISGGPFDCLQEEEEDEEEEVPGFQSQASLYEERKRKQEEHVEKEKAMTNPPPPPRHRP